MANRKGFTLIEAVIALTIAAIGFAGVYELYAGSARAELASNEISHAARLADSLLASGTAGEESGEESGYAWRIIRTPIAEIPGLRRVSVEIETPRGRTLTIVSEVAETIGDAP